MAMAVAYAGEACLRMARRGHQVFGAISYCEEHPLHLFHERIQTASLDFGDAGLQLETVARALGLGEEVARSLRLRENVLGVGAPTSGRLRPNFQVHVAVEDLKERQQLVH